MVTITTNKLEYQKIWRERGLSILQSWEWGEVKAVEWNVVRIIASEVSVTIFLKEFPIVKKSFGYIPRGFPEKVLSKALLQEVVTFAKEELKLTHLVVDPDLIDKSKETYFDSTGFTNTGKTIQPNRTILIDITKEEGDLWLDLRATFRRNIKKAEKLGCKVEMYEEGTDALDRFWEIMKIILRKKKFGEYTYGYYKKIWDTFTKSRMTRIYIVTKDGVDLASYFMVYTHDMAYELYGGLKDEAKELRAGHLLKWTTIKDAKKMGLKLYDQWGVAKRTKMDFTNEENGGDEGDEGDEGNEGNEDRTGFEDFDKSDELYNISIFKQGFGGNYSEYLGQQTIVYDKVLYSLYKIARDASQLKVSLRKMLKS